MTRRRLRMRSWATLLAAGAAVGCGLPGTSPAIPRRHAVEVRIDVLQGGEVVARDRRTVWKGRETRWRIPLVGEEALAVALEPDFELDGSFRGRLRLAETEGASWPEQWREFRLAPSVARRWELELPGAGGGAPWRVRLRMDWTLAMRSSMAAAR